MSGIDTLKALGFTEQDTAEFQALSDDLGLSANDNPHKVQAVLVKGDITALIEKNVSEDNSQGVEIVQKHPAVLILESPKGRVAIPNFDNEALMVKGGPEGFNLIEQIVGDLS